MSEGSGGREWYIAFAAVGVEALEVVLFYHNKNGLVQAFLRRHCVLHGGQADGDLGGRG